jgi:hypothetical protein
LYLIVASIGAFGFSLWARVWRSERNSKDCMRCNLRLFPEIFATCLPRRVRLWSSNR